MPRVSPVTAPAKALVHNEDLPIREPATLDLEDGEDRAAEIIVSDEQLAEKDYLDELKFNEDLLVIYINRAPEEHAPETYDIAVNGRAIRVPVEQPVRVARKYVEVLARAQPIRVRTISGKDDSDRGAYNKIARSQARGYSFSVHHDPSPKGTAWLAKVMRES